MYLEMVLIFGSFSPHPCVRILGGVLIAITDFALVLLFSGQFSINPSIITDVCDSHLHWYSSVLVNTILVHIYDENVVTTSMIPHDSTVFSTLATYHLGTCTCVCVSLVPRPLQAFIPTCSRKKSEAWE